MSGCELGRVGVGGGAIALTRARVKAVSKAVLDSGQWTEIKVKVKVGAKSVYFTSLVASMYFTSYS
jgi:hypothetical protein